MLFRSPNTDLSVVDQMSIVSLRDASAKLKVDTTVVELNDATRSKFIEVADGVEYFNDQTHMVFDIWALKVFEDKNSYYNMNPESPEEYYRIVELVVTHYRRTEPLRVRKQMMEAIKTRYSEDLTSEAGKEFRKVIDICLAVKKFKAIRRLSKWIDISTVTT